MSQTRRSFLTAALGAAALPLLPRFSFATIAARSPRRDRVLLLVDLAGGNDGLNMVVPFEDDAYQRARPTLRLGRDDLLPLKEGMGLRKELAPLHERFAAGELAIVRAAGYPQPDRSHFRSSDIWHTASLAPESMKRGWIGRLGDLAELAGNGRMPTLMVGGGAVPLLVMGERGPAPQAEELSRLALPIGPSDGAAARADTLKALARAPGGHGALDFLREASRASYEQAAQVECAAAKGATHATYPATPLGNAMKLAAQLVAGGLDCTSYYVRQSGYDTHAFQAQTHALLLADLGSALGAFWQDIVAVGAAERIVVLVWSEFGRRVAENGSRGTDHGAAAPVLVMGKAVSGGLFGAPPSLTTLDEVGDLRYTTDFRQIYATLLEQWLEVPPASVLGETFETLPLIARRD